MAVKRDTRGKTLNQLARSTDKGRKDRASEVHFKAVTTIIDPGRYLRSYIYQCWTTADKKYKTQVKPLNPKEPDLKLGNTNVSVSCSCPDFLYRFEVANFNKGAARIQYSNGAAPVITNPQGKASLCKHLVAIQQDVFNKNKKDVAKYEAAEKKLKEYEQLLKTVGRR